MNEQREMQEDGERSGIIDPEISGCWDVEMHCVSTVADTLLTNHPFLSPGSMIDIQMMTHKESSMYHDRNDPPSYTRSHSNH